MATRVSYKQARKRRSMEGPALYTWQLIIGGMIALFTAAFLPDIGLVKPLRAFSLYLFHSLWVLKALFIAASAAHFGEAKYVWRLAKKVDPANSTCWFWQTLALGIFLLHFLLQKVPK